MWVRVATIVEKLGTSLGVGGLLGIGFYTGLSVLALEIGNLAVMIFGGALSVVLFSGAIATAGLLFTSVVWRTGAPRASVSTGPPVEAIIPAYQEAEVLHQSVEALLENEYDPLRITIVLEPNDYPTQERARELANHYDPVEWLVNGTPGSKATAINYAVRQRSAEYFVVFDAYEQPSPYFVPTAMSELLGGTDVFQGRRVPRPTGAVETLAYCDRVIVQTGYHVGELLGMTHIQSAATGFTREAFAAVGGYEDMLTEDIYFSHQCHRADLTVTRNSRVTSLMEAPHTLRDLWGQRKRWRIGHVQVAHRRIHESMTDSLGFDDFVTIGRSIGAVLAGAVFLVLTAHVLFVSVVDIAWAILPFVSIFGTIVGVWARDALDGRVGAPSWSIFLAPLVCLGQGVLTVKAILEYGLTWNGEWYRVARSGG